MPKFSALILFGAILALTSEAGEIIDPPQCQKLPEECLEDAIFKLQPQIETQAQAQQEIIAQLASQQKALNEQIAALETTIKAQDQAHQKMIAQLVSQHKTLNEHIATLETTVKTQQEEIQALREQEISANRITSGTLDAARIPNLSANKITTGQLTAAANVKLNGHWLSGDGGNEGVYIENSGNVGIGTANPNAKLEVAGNIAIPGGFIHYGNRGKIGEAKSFNPNNGKNGLWIEGSNSGRDGESGGIFMNDNTIHLWSPGDDDVLRVYDEDHFDRPLFVINSNGIHVKGDIAIPGGIIHYGNRGKIGNAKSFNPNNGKNGLWIEGSNSGKDGESGGIFMNDNTIRLWSPGDDDVLRVYDEDHFERPLFVINSNGIHVKGAIRIGDWEISENGRMLAFKKNGNIHVKFDDRGPRIWDTGKDSWISDLRFKTHIEPLIGVTDKLAHLRAVYFNWNDHDKVKHFEKKTNIGLIADELEKVFPELVSYDKEGYRYIHYDKLSVVLLAAIKELHQLVINEK
jgi:outer membrane murein-binding lipoprotein Lpp